MMTEKFTRSVSVWQFWLGVAIMLVGAGSAWASATSRLETVERRVLAIEADRAKVVDDYRVWREGVSSDLSEIRNDLRWLKEKR